MTSNYRTRPVAVVDFECLRPYVAMSQNYVAMSQNYRMIFFRLVLSEPCQALILKYHIYILIIIMNYWAKIISIRQLPW